MSWDPDVYMKFATERTRPAVELLARVPLRTPSRIIDLGCGPGNSTALLAARWPEAEIEGLESSPEMLVRARGSGLRASWTEGDVANWVPTAPYDVVFSNAVFQWISDHRALLPRLMNHVAAGGALAFQVPRNFDAPSHALMRDVASAGPWAEKVAAARERHVLPPEKYFDMLAPLSTSVDIWETTYLQVLEGEDPVLAWVSGTGLRPFVQPLGEDERKVFLTQYRARLRNAYPRRPDGKTLFPFQRLFVVARR
ncbi:MAG TPA: trans-aconitate 2-methyltransferase [Rhizomicrobium sp.]|jgi:trans-aconitate 2-methyltransferase|nr:trans-aconitate 2-methyltransferase [Rhizomicrobium sp.]